jgi:competence protein ComEA
MSFLQRIIDEYWVPLAPRIQKLILAMGLGLVVLVVAVITSGQQDQPVPANSANPVPVWSSAPKATLAKQVLVHIVGQVVHPGVYQLKSDARVMDAVFAAGGFTPKADQASVNLARPLEDGEQVLVLALGASSGGSQYSSTGSLGNAGGGSAKINVNRASATELDALPGIGPTLAGRIVDYRSANGPFVSVNDLGKVSGIGPRLLANISSLVTY